MSVNTCRAEAKVGLTYEYRCSMGEGKGLFTVSVKKWRIKAKVRVYLK